MKVVEPTVDQLRRVQELYDRDQCWQAWQAAEAVGPLRAWRGTAARVLAGRVARTVEAPQLGAVLLTLAYRENRRDPAACYFQTQVMHSWRGPLAAWEFLERNRDLAATMEPLWQAHWFTAVADALIRFRDFVPAAEWLDRADAALPDNEWVWYVRSDWFHAQDRYEEALAAVERALALRSWYRPSLGAKAQYLQLLGRDDEALALLKEATARTECASLEAQYVNLLEEHGEFAAALAALDRYERFSPIRPKSSSDWLAGRRSDMHARLGDRASALAFAKQSGHGFFKKLAERMEQAPPAPRRVRLPVEFVRQHHLTCAPATLTALSRYWNMPADHLEVAADICYDGTPDHSERAWAEDNGFRVVEFRVTWAAAVALLERRIPFAMATVEPTSAHLQAIIGFDEDRGTLVIRDPYRRVAGEASAAWLEDYRSSGPRGMALVPADRAELLAGLSLPESSLYDQYYRLQRALLVHDRATALRIAEAMAAEAPGERLTIQARRTLAIYDDDTAAILDSNTQLLALYPQAGHFLLSKLWCLRQLSRREESLAFLRGLLAERWIPAVFWQRYAQELRADTRDAAEARRWLRRAIRHEPTVGQHYLTLASVEWDTGQFATALQHYRFAATLDNLEEHPALSYFRATRFFRQTETGLTFLRERHARHGVRSSQPARTFFEACELLERLPEGFAVLEEACRRRPDDGPLLLFMASAYSRNGDHARSAELLQQAADKSQRAAWLRASARLARHRGDAPAALAAWQEVALIEPLAVDAHRELAQLLAETQGAAAARGHLAQVAARFPHHAGLQRLLAEHMREAEPAEREAAVRHLLAIDPTDCWALRELAYVMRDARREADALAATAATIQISPLDSYNHYTHGYMLEAFGRIPAAIAAYRESIRLSADAEDAIERWLALCDTVAERREALTFIQSELQRQVLFGDGLLAFRKCARHTLPATELLAHLREAHAARPDLWHSWSALVAQLIHADQLDEALTMARQATERFPFLPRTWLDLADVQRARKNNDGELAALDHALALSPNWSIAWRRSAEAWQRAGKLDREREALERAVAREPLDEINHGCLADVLWRQGEKQAAFAAVKKAVELAPGYDWAWDRVAEWGRELEQPEAALEMARSLTRTRAGEARSWLMLARQLESATDPVEYLAALDHAIELNPRCLDAHDNRAWKLALLGRYDEAIAACRPPAWGDKPPIRLQGRAAWIETERGNRKLGIEKMQAVVEQDPDYYWGWRMLADWHEAEQAMPAYLAASEAMVRLAPDRAVVWGYRGDARLRNKQRPAGKEDLRKAMELDADYRFAPVTLFDAQLEDGELDAADATIKSITALWTDNFVRARQVQLLCRQRRDARQACELLAAICQQGNGTDRWPLTAAVDALKEARWVFHARPVLWRAMDRADTMPLAGELWAENAQDTLRSFAMLAKLAACVARRLRGDNAASAAFPRALLACNNRWLLWCYVRLCWQQLQADTGLWGNTLYVLCSAAHERLAIQFLGDYRQRAGVQPWMLINAADSLVACRRDREAAAVSRYAETLPPDHTRNNHLLLRAVTEALVGDHAAAAEALARVETAGLSDHYAAMQKIAQGMVDVAQAEPAQRGAVLCEARRQIRAAIGHMVPGRNRSLHRARRAGSWHMAKLTGGLAAWAGVIADEIEFRASQLFR